MSCFQEPYSHSKNKIKLELDSSNFTTKSISKSVKCINT